MSDLDGRDAEVRAATASASAEALPAKVWTSAQYAQAWYGDAQAEAAHSGRDCRRREVLFSVCAIEAYLFEWAWKEPLRQQIDPIPRYFPLNDRRGIRDRWKEVLKQLKQDELIPATPDAGGRHGEAWNTLIDYRDGLVHANSSLPGTLDHPQTHPRPVPTMKNLDAKEPGWAVGVVAERIRRLHEAVGSPPPEWL